MLNYVTTGYTVHSVALHVAIFWTSVVILNWLVILYKPVRTPMINMSRLRRLFLVWIIIAAILNIYFRFTYSWFMGATSKRFLILFIFIFINNYIISEYYWCSSTFFSSKWYGKYFTTAPIGWVQYFTWPYAFMVLALTLVPDFWQLYYYCVNMWL